MDPDVEADETFFDRFRTFNDLDEFLAQVHDSLDFYHNLSSIVTVDYITNEQLDLKGKEGFCPQESDFTSPDPIPPPLKPDDDNDLKDVTDYQSVGVVCYNFTSQEDYLEQNPVLFTLHFTDRGADSKYIRNIIANESDDVLFLSENHISLVVRRTSQGHYGIFGSKHKVKVSLPKKPN